MMSPSRRQRLRKRIAPSLEPDQLGGELKDFLARLDGVLGDLAGGEGAPPDLDTRHFLGPGMPRIRPVLVMLSVRAASAQSHAAADPAAAEQVAAAAELLHCAILLHDAALGRQGGRRRRAARRIIGGAVGVLGGNHLTLRALELTRATPTPEVIGDLLEAMREVSEGRALAQSTRERLPTVPEALSLAEGRTGAVFSFACRSGARLSGAERGVVSALGRYGRHAGVAWQLAEELAHVDASVDADTSGLEDRALAGAPGIAVCIASEADPGILGDWRSLRQEPTPERAGHLARRIEATGALSAGREHLARESWAARRALSRLEPSRYRDKLDRIAAGLAS